MEAARGSTVTFTCRAIGVPTPLITWRLNWGHIPVSGRWVQISSGYDRTVMPSRYMMHRTQLTVNYNKIYDKESLCC